MIQRLFIGLGLALVLSACGSSNWTTSYTPVEASRAASLRVTAIEVQVPDSLTVSEADSLMPAADLVWRGEAAGDRRAQIASIFRESAQRGAAGLRGGTAAKLVIVVERFHALTPRARKMSGNLGVTSIDFVAQLFDARSGRPLTEPQRIEADAAALVGAAAKEADQRGYSQKQEVTDHLTRVFHHWLGGRGADPRGQFNRSGL